MEVSNPCSRAYENIYIFRNVLLWCVFSGYCNGFLMYTGGKSAILTALCVAFGCRAKGTQRANTMKDFIKTGCRFYFLTSFNFFLLKFVFRFRN